MRQNLRGKDFLAFKDMNREEIEFLTDLSLSLKKKWVSREPHEYFKGRGLGGIIRKEQHANT